MTITGIDVSDHQSADYSLSGFDFVIVKATQGVSYVNSKHTAQVKRARDNGRVVGHYHFVDSGSMTAQADYFLQHAAPQPDDFLALDWETTSVTSDEKDQFLKYLKATGGGRKVLLYCNTDYWLHHDTSSYAADGLWIAQYNGKSGHPTVEAKWLLHQYTNSPVDTSVADFGSRAEMATWAKAKTPTAKVSLAHVIAAAKADPKGAQGHTTYPADVKPVEAALKAEGLLAAAYASDGSFGTKTVTAYAAWQRKCGYSGADADGIPGKASLTRLGADTALFTVTA